MSFQNALELWNGIDFEIVEDSNETIHCCFYLLLVSLKIACVNGIYMYMNEIKLLLFFITQGCKCFSRTDLQHNVMAL